MLREMVKSVTVAQGGVSLGEEMPVGPCGDLRGRPAAIWIQRGDIVWAGMAGVAFWRPHFCAFQKKKKKTSLIGMQFTHLKCII